MYTLDTSAKFSASNIKKKEKKKLKVAYEWSITNHISHKPIVPHAS